MVALFFFRNGDLGHRIYKLPTNTRDSRSALRLPTCRQAAVSCPQIAPRRTCPGEQIATSSLMGTAFGNSRSCMRKRQGRFFPKSMPHGRPFSGGRCRIKPLPGRADAARMTLGRGRMPHKRTFLEIGCRMSAGSKAWAHRSDATIFSARERWPWVGAPGRNL